MCSSDLEKQILRDRLINDSCLFIIGLMKSDQTIGIDADIRQAQSQSTGRATFLQTHFAVFTAIDFGLFAIVFYIAPNVADHFYGRRRWRGIEIGQKFRPRIIKGSPLQSS